MKLLFCYDGPMDVDKDGNAYPQTFTEDMLSRYYSICDKLTILTRTNVINKSSSKVPRANMKDLKVVDCPNLTSLKGRIIDRFKARNLIIEEMLCNEYVIIRLPSQIGNLALDIAIEMNKPYLVEVVACRFDTLWNHSLLGKIIAPYEFFKTKRKIKKAASVMYITENFLQRRYPTTGEMFACSDVALKPLDSNVLKNRYKFIEMMSTRKRISIASIGAVNMRYKGHEYMIKAVYMLIHQGYKVEYHLVGGGNSEYLKRLVDKLELRNNVFMHGVIPHDTIFNFLDNIDIYVQPSIAEAQGRSLIEAMSRGCPSVCTNVGGMPELLPKNFISKKGNPRDLAEKIILILNSDMKNIAHRNFEYARRFDANVIKKYYLNMYRNIFK
jgi:Glycosyltransferase